MSTNPDELERLRGALADRLDARPMQEWSAKLLAAVVAVIDMEHDSPPPSQQPGLRRLSLVPKPSNR